MGTGNSVQIQFLQNVVTEKLFVNIYLHNGVRLSGYIVEFDDGSVLLTGLDKSGKTAKHTQLLYRHAIATITPGNENESGTPTKR